MQGFLDKMQGFLDVSRFWNSEGWQVCGGYMTSAKDTSFLGGPGAGVSKIAFPTFQE